MADREATRQYLAEERRAGRIPPGPINAGPPPALPPPILAIGYVRG